MVRAVGVDGGVVFCRRSDWEKVGGYDESRLYAEDIQFLMDLKRHGKFRRARGAVTTMSTRKWDKYGDWHFFGTSSRLAWLYFTDRRRADELGRGYWYDGRR